MNDYINSDKEDFEKDEDPTIGDLINSFKPIGLSDHVYAVNDDVFLLDNISDELKNKKISEVSNEDEDELIDCLEIMSGIASDNERELTEDDMEEIEEDKMYRGEDIDD
ncbi:hypothetical protein [Aliarcobacter butzleri]|uniref:hypothetical protein n=1 Tax=Aliarcobacter butzleri TaxID=28197 RepID=UPI001EDAA13C|nr:hypothetical protein [Aliarcobacter butzleri]MCG3662550.1 hypothetical protein [Aliarcobacter butzleri]MDN5053830.1 hypothetical protein [Aliarcobacter butzleri]